MNSLPVPSLAELQYEELPDPKLSARRRLRIALGAAALLVIALLSAAMVVRISGAVIGYGQVAVETQVKRIAHPTGGVVADILVRDGSRVRRGDILMRFDTTVSGTSATLAGESVHQLRARIARLEAEREERPSITFPQALVSAQSPAAEAAMASEQRLFQIRRSERAGQAAQLNERVQQMEQLIRSYEAQIGALNQQAALIQPELEGVRALWERRLVTLNRVNQLERTAVDLNGSMASLRANIAQARARISETREQSINLRQSTRAEAGSQLAEATSALNDQEVRRVSAGDTFDRSVIRAPADGVVDKLAFTTIGGVVPPTETIMEIVPDRDNLTVEARISPADVDQVRVGQRARIRFSAFSAQTTPEIPGTVSFVSAARATDAQTGASFYRVRISIDAAALRNERAIQLVPGMPAETFIETTSRSLLSYITKPLRDQFERAFRDN